MKLHSPAFEKALRRTVKQRIKASPELRKEARRNRTSAGTMNVDTLFQHLAALVFLPLGLYALGETGKSLGLQLAFVSVWCFMMVLFHVGRIFQCLFASTDLAALSFLPIADATVFHWQWQKTLWRSVWLFAYAFVAYLVIAQQRNAGWPGVAAALVAAGVQWLLAVSLATGLAGHRPQWPYQLLGLGLLGLLVIPVFARNFIRPEWISWLDGNAWVANFILPTGWVSQLFSQTITGFNGVMWLLLLAVVAVFHFGRSGREVIASVYGFADVPDTELPEEEMAAEDDSTDEEAAGGRAVIEAKPWQREGITDHLDQVRSREFLQAQPLVAAGWIERLFQRWLTPREMLLVEAFVGALPAWTSRWKRAFIVAGLGLLVGVPLPPNRNEIAYLIYLLTGLFSFFMLTPVGGDFRRLFQGYQIGSVQVPFMAGFPVGFREILRLYWKASCVRALAALPILMVFSGLVFHFALANDTKRAFFYGLCLGFKLGLIGLVLQPALCANWLSRALTHRRSHFLWRCSFILALTALSIILVLSLLVGYLLHPCGRWHFWAWPHSSPG